jgi:hypothetical protein
MPGYLDLAIGGLAEACSWYVLGETTDQMPSVGQRPQKSVIFSAQSAGMIPSLPLFVERWQ